MRLRARCGTDEIPSVGARRLEALDDEAVVYAGGEGPSGVAIADFNKDGRPDVVVTDTAANLDGGVSVLLNTTH